MPHSILVVDDDELVSDALCDVLSYLGYTLYRAYTAEEGWSLLQQHNPSVVLTDNRLRGELSDVTGLDFARRVKQVSPNTPVIMLSAMPPEEAKAVCDVVLSKPIPMRVLMEALRQLNIPAPADAPPTGAASPAAC